MFTKKTSENSLKPTNFCSILDSLYGSDCYDEDFFLGSQFSVFYTTYFQEFCPTQMNHPPPEGPPHGKKAHFT